MYDFDLEPGDIAEFRGEPPLISSLVLVRSEPDDDGNVEILSPDGEVQTVPAEALSAPGINWSPDDIDTARALCEASGSSVDFDDEDNDPELARHYERVQDAAAALEISCRLYRRDNPGFRPDDPDVDHEHVKAIILLAAKLDAAAEAALDAGCGRGEVMTTCALTGICDFDLTAA
ncbi:MAG TPA: hypothetical protein VF170_08535 [Planctomycetaceae bacterium]